MRLLSPVLITGLLWSAGIHAHAHLVGSVPADHAELPAAPKEATLTFAEPVVLTSVKLVSPDGTAVSLKPLPEGGVKQAHLPLPTLSAGSYHLKWRATSDDGHVMAGDISFVVNGPAPK